MSIKLKEQLRRTTISFLSVKKRKVLLCTPLRKTIHFTKCLSHNSIPLIRETFMRIANKTHTLPLRSNRQSTPVPLSKAIC